MISVNYKISAIFNKNIPILKNNLLYSQHDDTIYMTDLQTKNITQLFTSSNLKNWKIDRFNLIYYNTDLFIYNLETNKTQHIVVDEFIKYVFCLKQSYVIINTDGGIFTIKENSKIFLKRFKLQIVCLTGDILYFANNNALFSFNFETNELNESTLKEDIVSLNTINDKLIICTTNTIYFNNESIIIEGIRSVVVSDNYIIIEHSTNQSVYDNQFNLIKNCTSEYKMLSDFVGYNNEYKIYLSDQLIFGDIDILDFIKIEDKFICCSKNNLILIKNITDNTTNILEEEKVAKYKCCSGVLLDEYTDTLLSVSVYNQILLTTCMDGTVSLYKYDNSFNINLIKKYTTGVMNSSALNADFCVMCGDGGMLGLITLSNFNLVLIKISQKDLNCVSIFENLIYVGGLDKILRVYDYDLNLIKEISDHKKGIASLFITPRYICTGSSDKTIRVYDRTYKCISILTGHDTSVICIRTLDLDKKLISSGMTGLIKIWNITKGLCTENIQVNSDVWSMTCENIKEDFILCGTKNQIVQYRIYKDTRKQKNEVYIQNKEYDKVITDDNKLIYRLIKDSIYDISSDTRNILLRKYKHKIYDLIIECGRIKDIEFIIELLQTGIKNNMFDKKVVQVLKKLFVSVDDLYGDLVSIEQIIN